jgi:major outer membrane protein
MKKLVLATLSILTCGAAYALPVGNPAEASLLSDGLFWEGYCGDPCDPCSSWCDAWSIRVGFYGDYVFNRHIEVDDSDGADVDHAEIYTNAGYLAFNLWDRLDIFATLGATNAFTETNLLGAFRLEIETETHFSWSIGARATIWECGCTAIGIEGQYFRFNPDIRRITVGSLVSVYPDDFLNIHYHEWQIGLGISHRINMFVPYAAVKYSRFKIDTDNVTIIVGEVPVFLSDFENKKHWGYAIGVSLIDCEKALVTVEGRWADEKALYVNGQIRF